MILVTGAARGLGARVVQVLAQAGHDVLIHYRTSKKQAEELAQACKKCGVQAAIVQGDFGSKEGIKAFILNVLADFSQIKGVVNNVGEYFIEPLAKTSPNAWEKLFNANFFAPVFLIQALLPTLIEQRASIVNVGVAGLKKGISDSAAYATTKSALLFYTVSLAKQLADSIRINMVSPGFMENSIEFEHPEKLPLKRTATLDEVAQLIALFFDSKTDYVTGQNIEISGGIGL
ncbi:MAG: 3-oxoacyl-[acyl-carrier-protein] reductase FabG [Chlamydiales bacterium]|nr:3-oxoacyl-[acyl-carrier-protein] reductase FabG [Chlamydiales bacterium]